MSNRFFYDPDFMDFSNEEKLTFFFILGEASQQNKYGEVSLNETLYSRITGFNKRVLFNTVDKLLILGAAAGSRQDGGKITTATVHNSTEHNTSCTNPDGIGTTSADEVNFDFEKIYNAYPKRLGAMNKQKGITHLRKKILNQEKFALAFAAAQNYNRYAVSNGKVKTEYVMQFSKFFGPDDPWLEWAEIGGDGPKLIRFEKE